MGAALRPYQVSQVRKLRHKMINLFGIEQKEYLWQISNYDYYLLEVGFETTQSLI